MPLPVLQNSTSSGTAGGSTTVSAPAGTTTGDLLIVICATSSTTAVTGHANFTLIRAATSNGDSRISWWYRVIQAGDPSSWAFTFPTGAGIWASLRVTGQAASGFIHQEAEDSTTSTRSYTAPAVTTTVGNCLFLCTACADTASGETYTGSNAASTEVIDTYETTGYTSLCVYKSDAVTAGTYTGTMTGTVSSEYRSGLALAVKGGADHTKTLTATQGNSLLIFPYFPQWNLMGELGADGTSYTATGASGFVGNRFQLPAACGDNATIREVRVLCGSAGASRQGRIDIKADNAGARGSTLYSSGSQSIASKNWYTWTIPEGSVALNGGDYFWVDLVNTSGAVNIYVYYPTSTSSYNIQYSAVPGVTPAVNLSAAPSMGRVSTLYRTLTATLSLAVNLLAELVGGAVEQLLSVTLSTSVALQKAATFMKLLAIAQALGVSIADAALYLKALTAQAAQTVSVSTMKVALKLLGVAVGSSVQMAKQATYARVLSALANLSASLARMKSLQRTLGSTAATTVSLTRLGSLYRTLSVTAGTAVSLGKAFAVTLATAVETLVSQALLQTRGILLRVTLSVSVPFYRFGAYYRTLTATAGTSLMLSALFTRIRVLAVSVGLTTSVAVLKSKFKTLTVSVVASVKNLRGATLGKTTAGSAEAAALDYIHCAGWTMPGFGGKAQKLWVRVNASSGTPAWKAVLYADSGAGKPGRLLWVSAEQTATVTKTWYEFDISASGITLGAGLKYFIGIHASTSTVQFDIAIDGNGLSWQGADTYSDGTLTDASQTGTAGTWSGSAYLTYDVLPTQKLTATLASVVSLLKSRSALLLSVTAGTTVSFVRQLNRRLTRTVPMTTALTRGRLYFSHIYTAVVPVLTSVSRSGSQAIVLVAHTVPTVALGRVKSLSRVLTATVDTAVSMVEGFYFAIVLAIAQVTSVTLTKGRFYLKSLAVTLGVGRVLTAVKRVWSPPPATKKAVRCRRCGTPFADSLTTRCPNCRKAQRGRGGWWRL